MLLKLAAMTLGSAFIVAAAGCGGARDLQRPVASPPFVLAEATLADIQAGPVRAETLLGLYLARIEAYDRSGPRLGSVLHLNANASSTARELDAMPTPKGPLHGVPVLLKDNIDTADMPTTAGAVALAGTVPAADAFIVTKLRDAGAVLLGKAQLTEFGNFTTDGMPAGFSGLGGQAVNPYDPRTGPDGRPVLSPGGSSAGPAIATAANLTMVAIGTETSGSILSPAAANGVVGIKPTLGLVSRSGILPLSADQDTAGPIARTVRDAATVLGVIAGPDPDDPAPAACRVPGRCFGDYTQFLEADALRGARILVPPFPADAAALMEAAIATMQSQGATVVRMSTPLPDVDAASVLAHGFKRDLNDYLARRPASTAMRSLGDIVAFNTAHPAAIPYGQTLLVAADALSLDPASADTATYRQDLADGLEQSRRILTTALAGPDGASGTADDFDALLFFGQSGAATPARAGYPSVVVPAGFAGTAPGGVTFTGLAFSEPRLIALAYAFEQATRLRRPPASTPPLPGETGVKETSAPASPED